MANFSNPISLKQVIEDCTRNFSLRIEYESVSGVVLFSVRIEKFIKNLQK